jgi:hypothetical protein
MPLKPDMHNYPDYGQFTDNELRILNRWGESQGKTSYRAAINTLGPVPPGDQNHQDTRTVNIFGMMWILFIKTPN